MFLFMHSKQLPPGESVSSRGSQHSVLFKTSPSDPVQCSPSSNSISVHNLNLRLWTDLTVQISSLPGISGKQRGNKEVCG